MTTVFNLNQGEWIRQGYGKKVLLLENNLKAFKIKNDLNEKEKQKSLIKSLIILYIAKLQKAKFSGYFHNPMMVVFVNSINIKDADAEIFFNTLKSIINGDLDEIFDKALKELKDEFKDSEYLLSDESGESVNFMQNLFDSVEFDALKDEIFYAKSGNMEAIRNKFDEKELAFKLDTANKPFCLLKIGDTGAWIKEKLDGMKISETYKNSSYFENIDRNSINILLGSRSFYEGWDTNRPNVMLFLNIGLKDTKKFITQAIGRGMRIETVKNNRKRLENIDKEIFYANEDAARTLQTLFIIATANETIKDILEVAKEVSVSNFTDIKLDKIANF
ncbi:MAG: hypothetical protein MR902_00820 [Campylobacter sp.]|nr:hypothetical protein [Campylobacter sp.]